MCKDPENTMHDTTQSPASSPAQRDAELVNAAIAGEPAAFAAIVRCHNRLLFRTARGIVADDDAQDVVQETYLRAFGNLRAYRGDAALGTWLARIAINVALDLHRKRRRLEPFDENGDDDERVHDKRRAAEDDAPYAQAGRH